MSLKSTAPVASFLNQLRCLVKSTSFEEQDSVREAKNNAIWLWNDGNCFENEIEGSLLASFICIDDCVSNLVCLFKNSFKLQDAVIWSGSIEKVLAYLYEWFKCQSAVLQFRISSSFQHSVLEKSCMECYLYLAESYKSLLVILADGAELWKAIVNPLLIALQAIRLDMHLNLDLTSFLSSPIAISWLQSHVSLECNLNFWKQQKSNEIATSKSEESPLTCLECILYFISNVKRNIGNLSSRYIALSSVEATLQRITPLRMFINQSITREFNSLKNGLGQIESLLLRYKDVLLVVNTQVPLRSLPIFNPNQCVAPPCRLLSLESANNLEDKLHAHQIQVDFRSKSANFLFKSLQLSSRESFDVISLSKHNLVLKENAALQQVIVQLKKDANIISTSIVHENCKNVELARNLRKLEALNQKACVEVNNTRSHSVMLASEKTRLEALCALLGKVLRCFVNTDRMDFELCNDCRQKLKDEVKILTKLSYDDVIVEIKDASFEKLVSILSLRGSNVGECNNLFAKKENTENICAINTSTSLEVGNKLISHYRAPFYKKSVKFPENLQKFPENDIFLKGSVLAAFKLRSGDHALQVANQALFKTRQKLFAAGLELKF